MSRRIETGDKVVTLGDGDKRDSYIGRLVGYIPSEIVGLYLFATGMVPATEPNRQTALWIIFSICALVTILYMWRTTHDRQKGPLYIQIILATIAFPVWVFALGGPFMSLSWYKGWIASIVLAGVTLLFGLIEPKPGT